ncbi:MAG: hypothetical protein Q9184_004740 [Pyrenodesmia sp. 2 TL-2023]
MAGKKGKEKAAPAHTMVGKRGKDKAAPADAGTSKTKEPIKEPVNRPIFTNYTRLAAWLDVESAEDLKQWMASDLYEPAWKDLYEGYIKPYQEQCKRAGVTRRRKHDLSEVQAHLLQSEAGGKRKFSRPRDRTSWESLDHYARFLWWVANENTNDQHGIFFDRRLSEDVIHQRVWMVLQRSNQNITPSHVKGGIIVRGERASDRIAAAEVAKASKPSSSSSPQAGPALPENMIIDDDDEDEDEREEEDVDQDLMEGSLPKAVSGCLVPQSTLFQTPRKKEAMAAVAHLEDDLPEGMGARFKAPKFTPLAAERQLEYRRARPDIPDFRDPFWAFGTLNKFCDEFADHVICEQITQDWYGNDRTLGAEGFGWAMELAAEVNAMIEEPTVPLNTPCQATTSRYNEIQSLLDRTEYQRNDYEGACQRLDIVDPNNPRLRSMPRGKTFFPWQVLAIDAIMEFSQRQDLRGCVLADDMGLGKTMTVAGYLARHNELRQRMLDYGDDVTPPMPSLIVMPNQLMDNWVRDCDYITPDVPIAMYYGHPKAKYGGNVTVIQGTLTKQHPLFNKKNEINARTIVLTSAATLARRHGPKAQAQWRMKQEGWSINKANAQMNVLDQRFPYCLEGCFKTLVIDEAHIAKRMETATHITLKWLNAMFSIPVSATPLINHQRDYLGFISIIEKPGLWSTDNLQQLGVTADIDPFAESLDDKDEDEGIRQLRCTTAAFRKFIAENKKPEVVGPRLGKVFERSMIRRTYQSRIPFHTGPMIGESIPPVYSTLIETAFTEKEQSIYDPLRLAYQSKLAKRLNSGKIVWNMRYFRQLILLGTWLGFQYCQHLMPAKRTKALLDDPNCVSELVDVCTSKEAKFWPVVDKKDDPLLVASTLRGSPKLRALMKVLSRQVFVQQEKAIVWTTFPAQQTLVVKLLRKMGIDAHALHAGMSYEERRQLVKDFSEHPTKVTVLVPCWAVGSYGYNFQYYCHNIHLLDPAPSEPIENQAIHRNRRIGQQWYVIVCRYYLRGSFNEFHVSHNLRKALPGVMATLNERLMRGVTDGDDMDDANAVELGSGQWCIWQGKLTPVDELPLAITRTVEILEPVDLVKAIMEENFGDRIVVAEPKDPLGVLDNDFDD